MFRVLFCLAIFSLYSCSGDQSDSSVGDVKKSTVLFEQVASSKSGITFSNDIKETAKFNFQTFQYIFNGGGVAVGDLNNDGLEDIFLVSNQGENNLYKNDGELKFTDVTSGSNLEHAISWKTGANIVDVNQDGLLDIYVCKSGWRKSTDAERTNLLYINKGDFKFVEAAKQYGLAETGYSIHSTFFDYDNDGDLDCYITNHPIIIKAGLEEHMSMKKNPPAYSQDKLYQNNGGIYRDVSHSAGIKNFTYGLGIIATDINQDGWVDLYGTSDYSMPDFMYINQKDGTFKDELAQRTGHASFYAMGVDIADINNDLQEDIFVTEMLANDYKRSKTNMASMDVKGFDAMIDNGLGYQFMQNTLQLNRGEGKYFSEIAQYAGIHKSDWSWGCLIEDFDSDGLRDIYVANGYKRDYDNRDVINSVFVEENQGKFSIDELNAQIPSFTPDNYFFKNEGEYKFSNQSGLISNSGPTNSQAVAMADFDNDGDLDLIVNNIDQEATLLENKSKGNNYINIRLKSNAPGGYLNAKVKITTSEGSQFHEVKNARGYIARSTDLVHFGLGELKEVKALEVTWLNGKVTTVASPEVNKTIVVSQKEAITASKLTTPDQLVISKANLLSPIHVSKEQPFNDYFKQILLPQKYSQLGPFMSTGDVNGDGKDDFYIGGPKGQAGAIYIKQGSKFVLSKQPIFNKDKAYEDMGSTFIDVDKDGDLDLYVVSGGNEYPAKSSYYADRLYLNDGKGNYSKSEGNIPPIPTSGSCVVAGDIDGDGDEDLFIGGRLFPNNYPLPTPSLLLRNDGGKFTDIAYTQGKGLNMAGLVTDAVFLDIDGDNDQDLAVVGEWTGVMIYTNTDGIFEKQTSHLELENQTKGWWKTIEAADLDGDGDKDLLVGNKGLNHKYTASKKKPLYIYADDFDGSGTYDVFLAKPLDDRVVPIRGRECTSEQMPNIKEKFPTFEEFADANLEEIINVNTAPNLTKLEVNEFASLILENEGGQFTKIPLPAQVQFSEANSINVFDINKDGNEDIIIVGNNYDTEVETCRSDASIGTVLLNKGNMNFEPLTDGQSDLMIIGNIKDANILENVLLVAQTNGELSSYILPE